MVALQLYWNHTSAWVFSCKFAAYFQNTFYTQKMFEWLFLIFSAAFFLSSNILTLNHFSQIWVTCSKIQTSIFCRFVMPERGLGESFRNFISAFFASKLGASWQLKPFWSFLRGFPFSSPSRALCTRLKIFQRVFSSSSLYGIKTWREWIPMRYESWNLGCQSMSHQVTSVSISFIIIIIQ